MVRIKVAKGIEKNTPQKPHSPPKIKIAARIEKASKFIAFENSPYVIFGLDSYSYALYSKELVYTAITRARKYCAVVTQNSAYRKAITVSKVKRKQTWLKELLWEYFNQKDYKITVKFEDEEERQDENRRKEETQL